MTSVMPAASAIRKGSSKRFRRVVHASSEIIGSAPKRTISFRKLKIRTRFVPSACATSIHRCNVSMWERYAGASTAVSTGSAERLWCEIHDTFKSRSLINPLTRSISASVSSPTCFSQRYCNSTYSKPVSTIVSSAYSKSRLIPSVIVPSLNIQFPFTFYFLVAFQRAKKYSCITLLRNYSVFLISTPAMFSRILIIVQLSSSGFTAFPA